MDITRLTRVTFEKNYDTSHIEIAVGSSFESSAEMASVKVCIDFSADSVCGMLKSDDAVHELQMKKPGFCGIRGKERGEHA